MTWQAFSYKTNKTILSVKLFDTDLLDMWNYSYFCTNKFNLSWTNTFNLSRLFQIPWGILLNQNKTIYIAWLCMSCEQYFSFLRNLFIFPLISGILLISVDSWHTLFLVSQHVIIWLDVMATIMSISTFIHVDGARL